MALRQSTISSRYVLSSKLLITALVVSFMTPGPQAHAGWWWGSDKSESASKTQPSSPQVDQAEMEGVVYTFDGTKVEGNPLLNDPQNSALIEVPLEGKRQADPDEALILEVDTAELDRTPEVEKRGLFTRFKDALKFGRKSEKISAEDGIEIELMPEDKAELEKLKGFSEIDIMSFLNIYKSVMGKATYLAKKAKLPESEVTGFLGDLSKALWAGAGTIINANARSVGLEVMAYGGGGASSWMKKLGSKLYLDKIVPEAHSWLFSGASGTNVLRVKDAKGRTKTFVEVNVRGDRSTQMRTFAGLGGYEVYLTRTWMTNVDPSTGKPPESMKATKTMVLGALGAISHGEGIFTVSLNLSLVFPPSIFIGMGGMSFPPLIGSVSVYDTAGKRKSLMTVGMNKVTDNMVTNSIKASYNFTKDFFGYGRGAKCEALFLP